MAEIIRDENNNIISIKGYSINDTVYYTEGAGDAEKLKNGVIKKIVEGVVLVKVYIDAASDEDVIFSWQIVPTALLKQKEEEKKQKAKAKAEAKEKRVANLAKAKVAKADAVRMQFMNGTLQLPARASIVFLNKVLPSGYSIQKLSRGVYNLITPKANSIKIQYTATLGKMMLDIQKKGIEKFIKTYQE